MVGKMGAHSSRNLDLWGGKQIFAHIFPICAKTAFLPSFRIFHPECHPESAKINTIIQNKKRYVKKLSVLEHGFETKDYIKLVSKALEREVMP